jgi:predicted CXXCH cytochrome family protein
MKKVVILVAIAALLAAPAFAGIRNSKHDLSSSSSAVVRSTNTDELCVFCHTPHAGETGGFAPLWNRSLGSLTFTATDLYNSATLESDTQPTQVVDAVNRSDAKLCLSCHDGGSLADGLLNPPASNGNLQPAFAAPDDVVSGEADLLETGETVTNGLQNDHPIGMSYTTALATADGELSDPATTTAIGAGATLPLYTTTNDTDVMWCSSCHDVHNPDKGTPFLNMTNDGSAMCLTCHIK